MCVFIYEYIGQAGISSIFVATNRIEYNFLDWSGVWWLMLSASYLGIAVAS